MISYIVMAVMHYIFLRRITSEHKEVREVFDIKFLALSSISIILLGVGVLFIYNYTVVRWVVIITILVVLFFMKNKIKEIFAILKSKK